jgi:hypothetical protein
MLSSSKIKSQKMPEMKNHSIYMQENFRFSQIFVFGEIKYERNSTQSRIRR